MSGFLTGPELSRDAVSRRLLAFGDVAVLHAARRPKSETTARLAVICLSEFFMDEGMPRERIPATAHLRDYSVPLQR